MPLLHKPKREDEPLDVLVASTAGAYESCRLNRVSCTYQLQKKNRLSLRHMIDVIRFWIRFVQREIAVFVAVLRSGSAAPISYHIVLSLFTKNSRFREQPIPRGMFLSRPLT
ncbi:unnamed protein product [Amoebophrya sp. A120]|nr:unnamed protein product [Amoebophrya sp. A120]|eukprot:GSA120T00017176001.1